MEETAHKESTLVTWVVILLCMLLILIKGLFAFSVVGDRGQPDWDYRPVKDVPGESPYAMYEKLPYPQHVKGSEGE
ncbi:MAG: hypothetical protein PVH99_02840 [Desulfobacteraceae bacterium]|jgi:hypothetical protein